jgi:FkbM family methyltransferase
MIPCAQPVAAAPPPPPDEAERLNALGNKLGAEKRLDEAEACYRRALEIRPGFYKPIANLGNLEAQRGRRVEAIALFEEALALEPGAFRTRTNLGNESFALGRFAEAAAAYRAALETEPRHPPARLGLGRALLALGQTDEALAAVDAALAASPETADLHHARGLCLEQLGRLDEAAEAHRRSLGIDPRRAHVHKDLAVALSALGALEDAARHAEQARAIDPGLLDAHLVLGAVRVRASRLDEGIACYRDAMALAPARPEPHSNVGAALQLQGRIPEGLAYLRRALDLAPDHAVVRSNLLMALHYDLAAGPRMLAEEHRAWGRLHGGLRGPAPPRAAPKPRLRVGYVSADLRNHSVARFVEPIFTAFDRTAFDVVAYSNAARPDAVTAKLRALVTAWRDVRGLSDIALAERIREDGIDILVDLGGHSADNRLAVFAHRPAPVQVTYLGYPDTTGLAAVDYRLTDAHADPPGEADALHVERLVRLPAGAWCYAPGMSSPVSEPPRDVRGHVTFGAFNDFAKVRPDMMALWAEILGAVPGSKLLLKAKSLADPALAREVRAFFGRRGIDEARVEARGWTPYRAGHLALHAAVDVALDTFPYHGTTTTCDALWMGVPVVTLAGEAHVSRVGASLLNRVGLDDLVARSPEEYVAVAVRLAGDRARLLELRRTLRDRVSGSPLGSPETFTRALEDAYRAMWAERCAMPASPAPSEDEAALPAGAEIMPTAEGARIAVPRSREKITPSVLYEQGDWFEDEIRFVRRAVSPGAVALDVGANYGLYSLALAHAVGPGGRVVAFEPAPDTARMLRASARLSGLGHLEVVEAAVSRREGEAPFYASRNAELSSLRAVEGVWDTASQVRVVTLDGMRDAWAGRRLAFVKLDAEGEEEAILEGARAVLGEDGPLLMVEIKHGATIERGLVDALGRLGFLPYRLVPGLGILVPFDVHAAIDPFLLNVFGCTEATAAALARRGLLGRGAASELPPEAGATALEAHAWAHAATGAPPAPRVAALTRARDLCLARPDSLAERLTLARVLAELGERGRAVEVLTEIEPRVAAGELTGAPRFLSPTPSFDGISPRGDLRRWTLAAVLAARERLHRFSSVFGSHDPGPLGRWLDLGYRDAEMARRLELVTYRKLLSS